MQRWKQPLLTSTGLDFPLITCTYACTTYVWTPNALLHPLRCNRILYVYFVHACRAVKKVKWGTRCRKGSLCWWAECRPRSTEVLCPFAWSHLNEASVCMSALRTAFWCSFRLLLPWKTTTKAFNTQSGMHSDLRQQTMSEWWGQIDGHSSGSAHGDLTSAASGADGDKELQCPRTVKLQTARVSEFRIKSSSHLNSSAFWSSTCDLKQHMNHCKMNHGQRVLTSCVSDLGAEDVLVC